MVGTWTVIGLAADAALAAMMYGISHRISGAARAVEASPEMELSPALVQKLEEAPDHMLPYCSITGLVQAQSNTLKSNYRDEQGVIQKLMLIEHRTKRSQGFWADAKHIVRSAVNFAPFKLVGCREDDPEVIVTEPLSAMYLMDDLSTTYDKYQPTKSTTAERTIDRVFGDVSRGFQETEQMLNIGTPLMGIGKLVRTQCGRIKLMPPDDHRLGYILTKCTKEEVIKVLRNRSRFAKTLAVIFTLIGTGYIAYLAVDKLRRMWEEHQMRVMLETIRTERLEESGVEDVPDGDENTCVICLVNPRQVIALNCGHACMCGPCVLQLPSPKKCPVCRQLIERTIPLYMS